MKKHLDYFDILRVMASGFVVFMHTAASALRYEVGARFGWIMLAIDSSLSFCAVPLFFMMSGYLLTSSNKTSDPLELLKNRLPKLILPLAFWSFIYILEQYVLGWISLAQALSSVKYALNHPINISLWFMYTLIVFYVISPLLCTLLRKAGKGADFCVLAVIFAYIVYSAFSVCTRRSFAPTSYIHIVSFVLGWYLGRSGRKISVKLLTSAAVIDLSVIIAGTIIRSVKSGQYNSDFQTQAAGFEIVLAVCIFLIAKNSNIHLSGKSGELIKKMAPLSFPVYMMHNAIITVVFRLIEPLSYSSVLLVSAGIYVSAYLIAYVLSLIPVLGYISCGIRKSV